MLCRNNYPKEYIQQSREKIDADIASYRLLANAVKTGTKPVVNTTLEAFEPIYFNNLVIVLEGLFVHRSRTLELKDGNPLNEVRMLTNSLLEHGGLLTADKTIKYYPAKSVLKLQVGEPIKVKEACFAELAKAFFAEMMIKFGK